MKTEIFLMVMKPGSFKMMPDKTLKFKGESCHGKKISKDRLSILLCASMTGEKRQAVIIGKYLSYNIYALKIKILRKSNTMQIKMHE